MSAYIALVHDDKIEILTDGAIYDAKGVIHGFAEKVTRLSQHRVAITTRGGIEIGKRMTELVANILDMAQGFDSAIDILDDHLRQNRRSNNHYELLIAGFSESIGPVTASCFSTEVAGQQPNQIHMSTLGVSCGAPFLSDGIRSDIIARGGMARFGVMMMEGIRRKRGPNLNFPSEPPAYLIGGHVDLTTVTATDVSTRRVHNWADRIGEPINPFGDNIVPLGNLNRSQRRAAASKNRSW